MSWEKAAHISTVLQLLIVVISAYFIWRQLKEQGRQLEQQTKLARVANTQTLVELSSPFNMQLAQDENMAELWVKGPRDSEQYTEVKKYQYKSLLIWWLIFYENIYYQNQNGMLDNYIYSAWATDIEHFVNEHAIEQHWSSLRKKYQPEFVKHIDGIIEAKKGRA